MHLAIGAYIKDVSKSLWQISLTLTPRWNAVKLRFCPIFSTNLGIPFNRDLDCIKRQLFRGTSEHLASWRHTPFDTLVSLSILLEKQRQLIWLHIANCKRRSLRYPLLIGRAHTESTRHESTRMSYETNRLGVRGNMDTPMRERRICD